MPVVVMTVVVVAVVVMAVVVMAVMAMTVTMTMTAAVRGPTHRSRWRATQPSARWQRQWR